MLTKKKIDALWDEAENLAPSDDGCLDPWIEAFTRLVEAAAMERMSRYYACRCSKEVRGRGNHDANCVRAHLKAEAKKCRDAARTGK